MSKPIEKLKKQLIEISEVVNAFKSEAVQVKVVDKLLDAMIEFEKSEADSGEIFDKRKADQESNDNGTRRKKPGATRVLNQLLNTDYFKTPHSISAIADHCRKTSNADFKTSELSGILLKLSNEHKLKRQRNDENNRFEYVKI